MGKFFDEAARVLASSMPRRTALRLIGSAAAAGLVAAFVPARTSAQSTCLPSCKEREICCPGGDRSGRGRKSGWGPFCIPDNETCCGSKSCKDKQRCVNDRCEASKS